MWNINSHSILLSMQFAQREVVHEEPKIFIFIDREVISSAMMLVNAILAGEKEIGARDKLR